MNEKWKKHVRNGRKIITESGGDVATVATVSADPPLAWKRADRIVACVNACAGLNPEAVPEVVAAVRWLLGRDDRLRKMEKEHPAGTCNAEDAWSDFSRSEEAGMASARAALSKLAGEK